MTTITHLPVACIRPGNNDRKTFAADKLAELAASIAEHGLAQPITVRPLADGYEIVAGERRFRAMRDILHSATIPCLVQDLTDEQASAIMLAENTARVDLNCIEEAESYQARITRFGWSAKQLADRAGVAEGRVKERLALLTLVPEIQHLLKFDQLPHHYAKLLVDLDANRQRIALRLYRTTPNMPLHRWRDVVTQLTTQQAAESQQDMFALEWQLTAQVTANAERVSKGLQAHTGAPAGRHLPPVRYSAKDRSMGRVFDRYIADLRHAGFESEAGAVGNIYNVFVALGWVFVPDDVQLPTLLDAGSVSDELHAQRD